MIHSAKKLSGIGLLWIGWLIIQYVLWIKPLYGFHHDYALGVFAWLWVGGEEGFSVMPNPCGLAINIGLTVFTTYIAGWTTRRLFLVDEIKTAVSTKAD